MPPHPLMNSFGFCKERFSPGRNASFALHHAGQLVHRKPSDQPVWPLHMVDPQILCKEMGRKELSLSAEGRFHHKSIHFLCVFNRLGRGKFVRQAHSGMGVPGVSAPNTNQLIATIGAIQHTDSEIHLSCVYGFLRANPAIIHQSSLPPPDSVARRAIHYDRDCKTHLSVRSCKRRRRL